MADIGSSHVDHPIEDTVLVLHYRNDGDHEHERRIAVSSAVLCLASEVFRNMFGPHFAEGGKLREAKKYIRMKHLV